ncbi:MAG TPA: hypothetical protein VKZ94_11590 [Advenella sp.]|nr:hypothetical protein [Advenella sp.]
MASVLNPNTISELPGKSPEHEIIQALFNELGITWSDIPCIDRDIQQYIWESKQNGIQLDFTDEGTLIEKPNHDLGEGLFILERIALWGVERGFSPYQGQLLNNVQLTDSHEVVLTKMGEPNLKKEETDTWRWYFSDYKINIGWQSNNKIRVISYWYTPNARPPDVMGTIEVGTETNAPNIISAQNLLNSCGRTH